MSGTLYAQLVWAVKEEKLPTGADELGLDLFEAGPVDEDSEVVTLAGFALSEEIEAMSEYFQTGVEFRELRAVRKQLKEKLQEHGIKLKPRLWLIHYMD